MGDCLDVMKSIPDHSVDMILADRICFAVVLADPCFHVFNSGKIRQVTILCPPNPKARRPDEIPNPHIHQ